jgi:glyoxylase-like metal-dependent hydrolase (beta-lactamase superfamily II)
VTDQAPPKYRKQEQEPAKQEITEVAPGVLRMQLPIHMPGLGHVNCYVLEDERGFAVVDPGMPGPSPWREFKSALKRADVPLERVHTAIVTHSHPDHFGGAGKLRREVGAEIVTHQSFRVWWDPAEPNDDVDAETQAHTHSHADDASDADHQESPLQPARTVGGPAPGPPKGRRWRWKLMRMFPSLMPTPRPTQRLTDAQDRHVRQAEWVAVHTPGHTADHLCLFDPAEGVFLSGDHVLPTITPHISGFEIGKDPLKQFFDSLDKVKELQPDGAHRCSRARPPLHRPRTRRAEDIKRHHRERLERLSTAAAEIGRPGTVPEFSHYLFSAARAGADGRQRDVRSP